jgi:hypothetical protein
MLSMSIFDRNVSICPRRYRIEYLAFLLVNDGPDHQTYETPHLFKKVLFSA